VDKALLARFKAQPNAPFALILKVSGDLGAAVTLLEARGITVRRRLALTNSLSFIASGSQALRLSSEPFAVSLEEDRPVRAWRES
jgi:hypothetical protein